jgi:dTDP-4-dehydrorhamnose reductase
MILLLGASGYIGQAFAQALRGRAQPFTPLSRQQLDYTRYDRLLEFLRETKPAFLINAAGYTGKPNVDACEEAKADTLAGNTLFPQTIAHACLNANVPWGHVSSGCIFSGAKVVQAGKSHIEKDLTKPDLKDLASKNPTALQGYNETDTPNFTFRDPPCSFYSGTKALAEEAIAGVGQSYIWRLRIPFDEFDNPRNYLTKIQRYAKVYDNVNSVSHRGDFVRACLDLKERHAPYGTYNVVNPGSITTREVVDRIQSSQPGRSFAFWKDDEEFYRCAAKTPRSNCILDTTKLQAAGVQLRPIREAIDHSLQHWQPTSETLRMLGATHERNERAEATAIC